MHLKPSRQGDGFFLSKMPERMSLFSGASSVQVGSRHGFGFLDKVKGKKYIYK